VVDCVPVSRLQDEEGHDEEGMETRRAGALKSIDMDPPVSRGRGHGVAGRNEEVAMSSSVEARAETTGIQE
jgi:hypothetical protein